MAFIFIFQFYENFVSLNSDDSRLRYIKWNDDPDCYELDDIEFLKYDSEDEDDEEMFKYISVDINEIYAQENADNTPIPRLFEEIKNNEPSTSTLEIVQTTQKEKKHRKNNEDKENNQSSEKPKKMIEMTYAEENNQFSSYAYQKLKNHKDK